MKYFRLTNLVFNVSKVYAGYKGLRLDIELCNNTLETMLEDGVARHGYIVDEIDKEEYEEEVLCDNTENDRPA